MKRKFHCIRHRLTPLFAVFTCVSISAVVAAPGPLSTVPLFTADNVPPNVFFEMDDSGSMDWEILSKKHWHQCAFNSNATGSTGSGDCGWLVDNGLLRTYNGSTWAYFEFIYANSDNAYSTGCSTSYSRQAITSCSSSVQQSDWRVRSSSVNVVYFDPTITYLPWQGTGMGNANFLSARSDPKSGASGYSIFRNLSGFAYEVWDDTHGYDTDDGRPRRGTNINRTSGANGEVDLWDEHTRYTVNSSPDQIVVERITYSPDSNGNLNESVASTVTLSGTGAHAQLGGKTVAEVRQNVANWYQYYRRRSFVAKGALGKVVTENPNYRYGMSVINNYGTVFTEVPAGTTGFSAHNTAMLNSLFGYNWPAAGTPLRRGLERTGKYYDDDLSGKADPIDYQCQQNFAVLFTDGYWNGSDPSSSIGNADGDPYSITVADVAKYYYDKDLSGLPNVVPGNSFDPASHQHMVTFTVAFGLTGLLTDADNDGWPEVSPSLSESADWGDPFNDDSPEKIDDLWHAAYNSRGGFVSASTPQEVADALASALANVGDRIGSAAAVAFNTATLTGSSSVYLAQFNSSSNKWSGDLLAFALNPVTGSVASTTSWTAASVLNGLPNPAATRKILTINGGTGVPFQWANLDAAQKADLKTNPDGSPGSDAIGQARLNFLRGDGSNEIGNGGTYSFRNRSSLLGDIVHSDPVFVGKPQLNWPSIGPFPSTIGTNTYADFKSGSAKNRTQVVYVGSNDGMLHGFRSTDGAEVIAYIPKSVFSSTSASSGLHYLSDPTYTHRFYVDAPPVVSDVYIDKADGVDSDGDGNNKDWHTVLVGGERGGGRGVFALDITDPSQFSEANAASLVLWEFSSSDDPDMGFTFSTPTIAMMNNGRWAAIMGNGYNQSGDGKAKLFVLFLDGGLDGVWTNGSGGTPVDYVEITTGVGSIVASDCLNGSSDCNGLSTPQVIDINGDFVADRVYAGDVKGNLWVFDLGSNNPSQWAVAYKQGATPKPLFMASYGSKSQPITSKPILVRHPSVKTTGGNQPNVMVYFGTGQYLANGDLTSTDVQSFYGVWDHGSHSLTPSDLVEQTFLAGPFVDGDGNDITNQIRVLTDNPVNYSGGGDDGWVINLTLETGERVVVDPDVRGDLVFFNTWIPESAACSAGGHGFLMSVKQTNGGAPLTAAFDLNGDNIIDGLDLAILLNTTDKFAPAGQRFDMGLPASSSFLSNRQYTPGTNSSSTIHERLVPDLGGTETGRFSWQELRE